MDGGRSPSGATSRAGTFDGRSAASRLQLLVERAAAAGERRRCARTLHGPRDARVGESTGEVDTPCGTSVLWRPDDPLTVIPQSTSVAIGGTFGERVFDTARVHLCVRTVKRC